jgi:T5SS/PEP-CTERM-associated repeat protein
MLHRSFSNLSFLGLVLMPLGVVTAASIDSAASGNWNDTGIWTGGSVPQTGLVDTANILSGHTIIYTSTAPFAGLDGSDDFGAGSGNSININGGVLSQAMDGWWVRIGHKGAGTLNINDGRFHITDGTGGGTNLQVGVETNGNGTVKVGDGSGAAGSAVLNLRDRVGGLANGGAFNMNLAASNDTVGTVTINSDGVLEGDQKTWNAGNPVQNPHVRIGQSTSGAQSVLTVNAGGRFNARGNVEIGSGGGAKGLLHLTGAGALMDMSDGELTVGFDGTGVMTVENGGVFSRSNTTDARSDLYVGRNGSGNGTVTIASGGEFRRGSGGNVGDLRIGFNGTGVLNVASGGLYHNESGNWDWLGQNTNSNGTVNVNGGTFEITSGSNLVIGLNGTGTFNHNSGSTDVSGIRAGVNNGTGLITISAGTFNVRGGLYLGGDSTTSGGNGSATLNQSGGATSIAGSLVVGIAANHTGTYNLTGGTITHTTSDISVGESGTGTLTIAGGASLADTSPTGQFYVGRNEGSSGTLIVDGTVTKSGSANAIRVGNGDSNGVDNTTAPGLLGGTGSITSAAGVRIGSHGTITGATTSTIGGLGITGNLSFSSAGTLHVDFNGSLGTNDVINVTGTVDITDALVDGTWLAGNSIGPGSRYWAILNDGTDSILGTFSNASMSSSFASLYPTAEGFVTLDGQEFAIFYNADSNTNMLTGGNDLLFSAVPEPSAAALLLMTGLGFSLRRRRPTA